MYSYPSKLFQTLVRIFIAGRHSSRLLYHTSANLSTTRETRMTLLEIKQEKIKSRSRKRSAFVVFIQQVRTLLYSINFIYCNATFNLIAFQRITNNVSFDLYCLNVSLYGHCAATVDVTRKISAAGYIAPRIATS